MIQNHCVSIKQATVLFFSSFLLAACGEPQPRTSVREKGRLTVVMDEPLPGYFVFGGESYGYQYDLFKAYADHLGVELQVVRSERPSEYDAMLADGRADIVTALSDHAAEIASLGRPSFIIRPMFCSRARGKRTRFGRRSVSS